MKDVIKRIEQELLNSFMYYSNPDYNPNLSKISRIEFVAQGEITSPPDFEFMGYGTGPEGETFTACGGINLESFFTVNEKNELNSDLEISMESASKAVLSALELVSKSSDFTNLPKKGPIIFILGIEDQIGKLLYRIHPDGSLELPPKD